LATRQPTGLVQVAYSGGLPASKQVPHSEKLQQVPPSRMALSLDASLHLLFLWKRMRTTLTAACSCGVFLIVLHNSAPLPTGPRTAHSPQISTDVVGKKQKEMQRTSSLQLFDLLGPVPDLCLRNCCCSMQIPHSCYCQCQCPHACQMLPTILTHPCKQFGYNGSGCQA
jgi:hypothetical protein